MHMKTMNRKAPSKPRHSLAASVLLNSVKLPSNNTFNIRKRPSRPSSVVERVAFNHVAVGSIPTVGDFLFMFSIFFKTSGLACYLPNPFGERSLCSSVVLSCPATVGVGLAYVLALLPL